MSTSATVNPTSALEELEFRRSRDNVRWFLSRFYHIPVIGTGPALFDLRDYQSEIIDTIDREDLIV